MPILMYRNYTIIGMRKMDDEKFIRWMAWVTVGGVSLFLLFVFLCALGILLRLYGVIN